MEEPLIYPLRSFLTIQFDCRWKRIKRLTSQRCRFQIFHTSKYFALRIINEKTKEQRRSMKIRVNEYYGPTFLLVSIKTADDLIRGTFLLAIVGWTARWKHNISQPAQVHIGAPRLGPWKEGGPTCALGSLCHEYFGRYWPDIKLGILFAIRISVKIEFALSINGNCYPVSVYAREGWIGSHENFFAEILSRSNIFNICPANIYFHSEKQKCLSFPQCCSLILTLFVLPLFLH